MMMDLYREDQSVIYLTQNKDPFFNYLTDKWVKVYLTKKKGRLLDLGCGGGRNSVAAAKLGLSAVGIDLYQKSLEVAKKYAQNENVGQKTKFIRKDLQKLKKPKRGKFDYCILQEVIEHLPNYPKVLDFAYSSLHKGGKLILTTPNNPNQWNLLDDYAKHVKRFRIEEVRRALSRYKKVQIFTTGFPLHRLIIYFYNQYLIVKGKKHNAADFRSNSILNKIYYLIGSLVLKFDHFFRFTPWGTTIVAVAEK